MTAASSSSGSTHGRHHRRGRRRERRRIAELLRTETVGGAVLVAAAVAALILANSPLADAYTTVRDWQIGPSALLLHLSIGEWAADGLLAIFFFLAGLELKREFIVGDLRDPRQAVVPVVAAIGGMIVPAAIYLVMNAGNEGAEVGWAIPTATDIAFALAVLAVVGRSLPSAVRTFLLTLAVVDDLLAIAVIAVFYTHDLRWGLFAAALLVIAAFALAVQLGHRFAIVRWGVMPLLAVVGWAFMHASGVHATVAGVLMGLVIPVIARRKAGRRSGEAPVIADQLDRVVRPVSAGLAVPLFAFFAAGVAVGGPSGLATALSSRIALGIIFGLVIGKAVGILVATLITARMVHSPLLRSLAFMDFVGLSILGGIGFTVSLLIGNLAFAADVTRDTEVQIGVVAGSLIAAGIGAVIFISRNRHYRRLALQSAE